MVIKSSFSQRLDVFSPNVFLPLVGLDAEFPQVFFPTHPNSQVIFSAEVKLPSLGRSPGGSQTARELRGFSKEHCARGGAEKII